jgi:Fe-S-cluster containining protein
VDAQDAEDWARWNTLVAERGEEVSTVLMHLYQDVESELATHDGRCDQSGRCCRFESYGHRLYVTALEVAWFLKTAEVASKSSPVDDDGVTASLSLQQFTPLADACRYQSEGLCSVHRVRPLGCRVFFCEGENEGWQEAVYEKGLARLRLLHEQWGVPYRYGEWRGLLAEADAFNAEALATRR